MSLKWTSILISLVSLTVILLGGSRIWHSMTSAPLEKHDSKQQSVTTTWKTLRNEDGRYELQYPSDLTLFQFHRKTDVTLSSSSTPETNIFVKVLWGMPGHYGTSSEELRISSEDVLDRIVDDYVVLWANGHQTAADGGNVTYKKEHVSFNGYNAISLLGTREASNGYPPEYRMDSSVLHAIFILHNGRVYKIQYQDLYYKDELVMSPDESKMLASFRFY